MGQPVATPDAAPHPRGSNRLRLHASNMAHAGASPAGDTTFWMAGRYKLAAPVSKTGSHVSVSRERYPGHPHFIAPVGNRQSPSLRTRCSAGATPAWSTNGYEYESSTFGLGPRRGGAVPPYPTTGSKSAADGSLRMREVASASLACPTNFWIHSLKSEAFDF